MSPTSPVGAPDGSVTVIVFTVVLFLTACTGEPADTGEGAHETLALAAALAERGAQTWPVEDLPFDLMQTVWGYGLLRLHLASGDDAWLGLDAAWMEDHVDGFTGDDPRTFHSSDSMSPALLASSVMVEEPSLELEPITEAAHAYLDAAPRTDSGAIEHWAEGSAFGEIGQVWVDSQFMFGVFLLSEYQRTGDRAHLEAWVEQYLLFSELCRGEDGLYRHAWDDVAGENIPLDAVYWNRGNSWVLVSAAEMLRIVGPDDPAWDTIQPLFLEHAEATRSLQADDGLWYTVLNRPTGAGNYTETSGSALIAYAFEVGLDSGALEGEAWRVSVTAAVDGVGDRVTEDLVVEGTSFGTNPGDYDYYVSVAQLDDIILGVGSVVMLLSEVDGSAR